MKALIIAVVVAVIAYFGMMFFGYQVLPQNLKYYIPQKNYIDVVKSESHMHPVISRKAGAPPSAAFDKGMTGFLKTVSQADKVETFKRIQKDIKKIQVIAEDRAKQVDSLTK